ncbi:MAG TPA: EamA family transporter RarD [Bdellovibrionota bacterium]|jgi:chloramphenicol-sensitive protein RarD
MSPASLAVLAYAWWGLVPIYWKQLSLFSSEELILYRILISAVSLLPVLVYRKELSKWLAILRSPSQALGCLAASLLIGFNWYLYIWAVGHGRVVESSLGYFLNPLVNVALGTLALGERMNGAQKTACALAALGVSLLAFQTGAFPWVSVLLALSFGFYGFVRKLLNLPTLAATFAETIVLTIPSILAIVWMSRQGLTHWAAAPASSLAWLSLSGIVTTVPLLAFTEAVKFLPLTFLAFLQFLSPTLQFLLGVLVFHEPFGLARCLSFGLIWVGIVVFLWDLAAPNQNKTNH